MEDNLIGRWHQWKTTSMEDDNISLSNKPILFLAWPSSAPACFLHCSGNQWLVPFYRTYLSFIIRPVSHCKCKSSHPTDDTLIFIKEALPVCWLNTLRISFTFGTVRFLFPKFHKRLWSTYWHLQFISFSPSLWKLERFCWLRWISRMLKQSIFQYVVIL